MSNRYRPWGVSNNPYRTVAIARDTRASLEVILARSSGVKRSVKSPRDIGNARTRVGHRPCLARKPSTAAQSRIQFLSYPFGMDVTPFGESRSPALTVRTAKHSAELSVSSPRTARLSVESSRVASRRMSASPTVPTTLWSTVSLLYFCQRRLSINLRIDLYEGVPGHHNLSYCAPGTSTADAILAQAVGLRAVVALDARLRACA